MRFVVIALVFVFASSAFAGCGERLAKTNILLDDVPSEVFYDSFLADLTKDASSGNLKKMTKDMRVDLKYVGKSLNGLKDEEIYLLWRLDKEIAKSSTPDVLKAKRKRLTEILAKGTDC